MCRIDDTGSGWEIKITHIELPILLSVKTPDGNLNESSAKILLVPGNMRT